MQIISFQSEGALIKNIPSTKLGAGRTPPDLGASMGVGFKGSKITLLFPNRVSQATGRLFKNQGLVIKSAVELCIMLYRMTVRLPLGKKSLRRGNEHYTSLNRRIH